MIRKNWSTVFFMVLVVVFLLGQTGPPAGRETRTGDESRSGYLAGSFRLEMDAQEQKGILQIVELVPYRSGMRAIADQKRSATHRVFARYITPPFKIIRIADYDNPGKLNRWVQDSIIARKTGVDPATKARNLDIVILKGNEEKIKFRIKNAWIAEISYSDLDRSTGGRIKETLIIESESINPIY